MLVVAGDVTKGVVPKSSQVALLALGAARTSNYIYSGCTSTPHMQLRLKKKSTTKKALNTGMPQIEPHLRMAQWEEECSAIVWEGRTDRPWGTARTILCACNGGKPETTLH
jgi:hypothetical protein